MISNGFKKYIRLNFVRVIPSEERPFSFLKVISPNKPSKLQLLSVFSNLEAE